MNPLNYPRLVRLLPGLLLSLLMFTLLTASRAGYADPSVSISSLTATYGGSIKVPDTVTFSCTGSYTTSNTKGHWILYEVITSTYMTGPPVVSNTVIASGDYTSGQVVNSTQYPDGYYNASNELGVHETYHYELFDEILQSGLDVIDTSRTTSEYTVR